MNEYLATTKDGFAVCSDPENSHASTHFADEPLLKEAVIKEIEFLTLEHEHTRVEVDTGTIVGKDNVVETSDSDEVIYALRPKRSRYSRFVKNRPMEPTSWIVISIEKNDGETANLYTAYVGRLTPSFPGGDFMPEQSMNFWSKHALVWGAQEVIPESVTSKCPW